MNALVLLHGFTGAPESFDELCALLPPDVRVIRPALTGHGPSRAASWRGEVDRLVALLRAEGIERAHLVGYSLGGRVGYGLLARAPELFAHATLIGAHPGLPAGERSARREGDARWIELLEREGLDAFLAAWEALPMWASQARVSPDRLARQRSIRRSHVAAGLAHALAVLGLAEMPAVDPTRLEVPLTLVAGALDEKHASIARSFAPRLRAGRAMIVPDAGHNVLLEAPATIASLIHEERC